MHPQVDEHTLIQRAQREDRGALGLLYELYVDAVYRFMFYRTGDQMVAEDLTAEVFSDVITAIARYEDRGVPFKAWLFRIARARLVDYWRSMKRREKFRVEVSEAEMLNIGAVHDFSKVSLAYENLSHALTYLTPAERDVILLRFAGGLNNEEIATVVNSNANAVKSMMRRALSKMKRILEQKASFSSLGLDSRTEKEEDGP